MDPTNEQLSRIDDFEITGSLGEGFTLRLLTAEHKEVVAFSGFASYPEAWNKAKELFGVPYDLPNMETNF